MIQGAIRLVSDPIQGREKADIIYTDVWISMGEPETEWTRKINLLKPYQMGAKNIDACHDNVIFMHCLPAFHNLETEMGRKMGKRFQMTSFEVTEYMFESKKSIVFDQTENRLHTIKAIMVAKLDHV